MNTNVRNLLCALTIVTASSAPWATAQLLEPAPGPQLVASAEFAPTAAVAAAAPFSSSASELPDAPSANRFPVSARAADGPANTEFPTAPKYAKVIGSKETAQPLKAGDKVVIAFTQLYDPLAVLGSLTAAGYTHLVNGAPNYGTNRDAFGQRVGAAFARGSSQEIFSDGVFAPILHIDPRYYILGPDYSVMHRTVYAVTRVLAAKTDKGRTTINAPLLMGYAGATGLSDVYYPPINRNFKDSAAEYGGSLGGAALGFLVNEFSDGLLKAVHLRAK